MTPELNLLLKWRVHLEEHGIYFYDPIKMLGASLAGFSSGNQHDTAAQALGHCMDSIAGEVSAICYRESINKPEGV